MTLDMSRRTLMGAAAATGGALPSDASFVYVKVPDANALHAAMAEAGVAIRPAYGTWTQYSRVSTGKPQDVARYAAVLKGFYRA